ncbi:MAG: hypothetical protein ACXVXR_01290 [Blastococcus sp.]
MTCPEGVTGGATGAAGAHPGRMAPATTSPPPGSFTVPPLFGWEHILTALLVGIVLAVAFVVFAAAGSNMSERREWQAFLDNRSHRIGDPATDPGDDTDGDRAVRAAVTGPVPTGCTATAGRTSHAEGIQ